MTVQHVRDAAIAVAALVLAIVGVYLATTLRQAPAEQKQATQSAARAVGASTPTDAKPRDVEAAARASRVGEQVAAVERAVPGLQATAVVTASTGAHAAHGTAVPSPATQSGPAADASSPASTAGCLVWDGDQLEVHCQAAGFAEADSGARALVGRAWVRRASDGEVIYDEKFRQEDVSWLATALGPRVATGWGVGGSAAASTSAVRVGLAVSPPLRPIFHGRGSVEVIVHGGAEQRWGGPAGFYGEVTGLVRWGH